LAIAARVPEARAVVTLAAPADVAQVADLDEISDQAQRQRIATLRRALLVIHSPDDEVVRIGNARVIFEAARHPKVLHQPGRCRSSADPPRRCYLCG
jgi:predicted alpha/beta hydrolase family esterase